MQYKSTIYLLLPLLFFCCFNAAAQKKFTISGTVRDAATGETLIGASVKIDGPNGKAGTATNGYGFYSLTVAEGTYTVNVSYVSYQLVTKSIQLSKNTSLNLDMKAGNELTAVVVSARDRKDQNVRSPQMGVEQLDMKLLDNLPVLFGEKDVLKTIQLLPGVKSGGEGNTGFFVRGGASDQNLILLDEATVYNSSHLLGFFSTFNADAIKTADLYKGGMPSQYGGRLSSVLDVKMNDGNSKNFSMQGGLGLISSRLKLEGPLIKDKSSFMISARRTYIDLILKAAPDSNIKGNTLNFYDLNAKVNYKFDDKNTIYLSGYFGQDNIGIKDLFTNDWGNTTATLRYNHIFNSRLFSNTSLIYNKYSYSVELLDEVNNFRATSLIRDFNFKQDFQYFSNKHTLRFGAQATHHRIAPSDLAPGSSSSFNPLSIENRYGLESSAYISDEYNVSNRLNLLYGLRASWFSLLGPGTFSTYTANGDIATSQTYERGKFVQNYFNLEPRFSASYTINERNSIKASYNRNTQNIHILSNSGSSSPTDQYVMSSNNIRPEIADQVAFGFFKNIKDNAYEFSAETYYKWMQNQIEYKDAARLLANADVESQLLFGSGRAYGLELYAKKRTGKLTGWISYTLSRTERKFAGLNNGSYFPARQDRTHDLAVVGIYKLNKRWTLSGNYIYNTGNAVTYPAGKYEIGGVTSFFYTQRNASRMPYTGRLDLSATLEGKDTGKRFRSSWSFGLYNALNRKNPYSIDFRDVPNDPTRTEAVQTALFGIIPSVTWNFKF
ncbi:TonB-dependent receptor [Mucilaginibacter aquatilis]|uniref:TonB-dependent receptor plug domain-containing protein n=1 Tax=Mucilaginibacter aquatilis TaxID=1517760 RepID=A0A6I4I6G0_9SPHI|nr:TonB-dependent receptor [Mucilaginibacter aquatilis]MVN89708.1 TonB-dependent receptor plug domain-containing protein [Mucilaginibacter aquatilis]